MNTGAKKRNHIHQLEALGYRITLEPSPEPRTNQVSRLRCAPPGAAAYPLTIPVGHTQSVVDVQVLEGSVHVLNGRVGVVPGRLHRGPAEDASDRHKVLAVAYEGAGGRVPQ